MHRPTSRTRRVGIESQQSLHRNGLPPQSCQSLSASPGTWQHRSQDRPGGRVDTLASMHTCRGACPISTGGGTRRVRLVRGAGRGVLASMHTIRKCRPSRRRARSALPSACCARPGTGCTSRALRPHPLPPPLLRCQRSPPDPAPNCRPGLARAVPEPTQRPGGPG
jgi:hypothetical protein